MMVLMSALVLEAPQPPHTQSQSWNDGKIVIDNEYVILAYYDLLQEYSFQSSADLESAGLRNHADHIYMVMQAIVEEGL